MVQERITLEDCKRKAAQDILGKMEIELMSYESQLQNDIRFWNEACRRGVKDSWENRWNTRRKLGELYNELAAVSEMQIDLVQDDWMTSWKENFGEDILIEGGAITGYKGAFTLPILCEMRNDQDYFIVSETFKPTVIDNSTNPL